MKEVWYSFKHRIFPRFIAIAAKMSVRAIFKTSKFSVEGVDEFEKAALKGPCIVALWHRHLVIAPEILFSFTPRHHYIAMVSNSQDGEIIAAIVSSYSRGKTLRVAHTGKVSALRIATETINKQKDIMVITPDGPRGPACKAKPGLYHMAKETDAMIIPLCWEADKYWQLNSWDQMRIPKPFSKITVRFGTPLSIKSKEKNLQDGEIAAIEEALNNNCSW